MASTEIRFGTDGWRAEIAREFTFANVACVARATGRYFASIAEGRPVVVGYDRRFLSDAFAETTAACLAENGLSVLLADGPCSTPEVSFLIKRRKAAGGVVLTASHNPAVYNGFKIKGDYGGPALPEITRQVESLLGKPNASKAAPGEIRRVDPRTSYLKAIERWIDIDAIQRARLRVVLDPMFGAGIGRLERLLEGRTAALHCIHNEPNPGFAGLHPEPIARNLEPLSQAVLKHNAHVGIANDGDADRVGIVDERGRFIGTQAAFALLLRHLVEDLGLKGSVVKTCSSTRMLDLLCEQYGTQCIETPVGPKYFCAKMIEPGSDVVLGGEESGGYGLRKHLPERDGILVPMLLLQMMAMRGRKGRPCPVSQLVDDLMATVGPHAYQRIDTKMTPEGKTAALRILEDNPPERFGRRRVVELRTQYDGVRDGYKFILNDGSWLLVRASGTEPLLRMYCEAPSDGDCKSVLNAAKRVLMG